MSKLECMEELKADHVLRGREPEILVSRICILLTKRVLFNRLREAMELSSV